MKDLAYYNGRIDTVDGMMIPMNDRACWFGDGVYDVTMVHNDIPYCFDAHIDRFFRSAALMRIDMPLTKDELKSLIVSLLGKVDEPDKIVYMQVTRGTAPRAHAFPEGVRANLWMTIKPGRIKPMDKPITLITTEDTRYTLCNVKTINLIPNCMAEQAAIEAGCTTAVFCRDGFVTECAHSNCHIIKDGKIITHDTDNLILPGIARSNLLRIAGKTGIPYEIRSFTVDEMMNADEVFTTSTTCICMRVSEIDHKPVGMKDEKTLMKLRTALFNDYLEETEGKVLQ